MKTMLLLALAGWGCAGAAAAQPAAPADTSRQLSCTIRPAKTHYQDGEEITFAVEVRNETASPQTLVKAVPGSESGYYFPAAQFEVFRLRGPLPPKKVAPFPGVFSRAVVPDDFVSVLPGTAFKPFADADNAAGRANFSDSGFGNLPKGEYEVRFLYSLVPGEGQRRNLLEGKTAAADPKAVEALLAQVPKVAVRSNVVRLVIER